MRTYQNFSLLVKLKIILEILTEFGLKKKKESRKENLEKYFSFLSLSLPFSA